jgi:hypothetical protein
MIDTVAELAQYLRAEKDIAGRAFRAWTTDRTNDAEPVTLGGIIGRLEAVLTIAAMEAEFLAARDARRNAR